METSLFGRRLPSPIVIGSGPLSFSADGMIRLHEAGAGAVVTKTINQNAADNPWRHMVQCDRDTLINCEKWSDYTMNFQGRIAAVIRRGETVYDGAQLRVTEGSGQFLPTAFGSGERP